MNNWFQSISVAYKNAILRNASVYILSALVLLLVACGGGGGSEPDSTSSPVKLIVVGNTGEGNMDQVLVAQAMAAKCLVENGCTAVLLAGNIAYDEGVSSTTDVQWQTKFEDPYNQVGLNGLAFYAVPGNHDYGSLISGSRDAMVDYSNSKLGSGKFTMPAPYYDVTFGSNLVHLFAIDTQDTGGGVQSAIMQSRLTLSTAVWKISMGSYPRFSSGNLQSSLGLIDSTLPAPGLFALQQSVYCSTDLYIAGGDRHREFIDKDQDASCPDTYFAISGAGSKVALSSEPALGNQLFYDNIAEGFAYLEFSQDALLFEFYDSSGNLSYSNRLVR